MVFGKKKQASKADDSKPIIYYWGNIKSRNFYIGMMLVGTGKNDKVTWCVNDDAGNPLPYPGTPEWAAIPAKTKSAWGMLPTLHDEASGTSIGESGAITRWLIKKFGLAPDDMKLYATSEQSIEASQGVHTIFSKAQYSPDRTAAMDALFGDESELQKALAGLESSIEGKPFVGSAATPGDYFLAAALMMCTFLQADSLAKYPKCKALHDHVHSLKAVKAYLTTVQYPYFKRNSD